MRGDESSLMLRIDAAAETARRAASTCPPPSADDLSRAVREIESMARGLRRLLVRMLPGGKDPT